MNSLHTTPERLKARLARAGRALFDAERHRQAAKRADARFDAALKRKGNGFHWQHEWKDGSRAFQIGLSDYLTLWTDTIPEKVEYSSNGKAKLILRYPYRHVHSEKASHVWVWAETSPIEINSQTDPANGNGGVA